MPRRPATIAFPCVLLLAAALHAAGPAEKVRRLSVEEYVDKMKAGWIGQMAGVGLGGPTEFRWKGKIIPEGGVPPWTPAKVNQFRQDDIYVEMTFLRTLELHGLDCTIRQAGIDFASSGYPLWHANRAGRDNLRKGIAPPDSGHPQFNKHADDIDYQIEADYSGLIAPGLGNLAIELGEKFGRLMNYGDGLYGGQFVGGMYAEAFFETDPVRIVRAGLACIPAESQYAQCIRDVLAWHEAIPDDWTRTWQLVDEQYHRNPNRRRFSCSGPRGAFNIDAKLNGAYIAIGLLYGRGDPDRTLLIATRCGQDSDCNPANAGGILFTTIGFAKLPPKFTSALDPKGTFSHTPYTFPKLIEVSKKLVRQAVVRAGGRVEKGAAGKEVFVIPVLPPKPSPLEQCWAPGPVAHSVFTDAEKAKIILPPPPPPRRSKPVDLAKALAKFAPGWKVKDCGGDMNPGLKPAHRGRKNVLLVHPVSQTKPCILSRQVTVPAGAKAALKLAVSYHEKGDWVLIVRAGKKELLKTVVSKATCPDGWREIEVDLSPLAGQTATLEILNQANGWSWEGGYFAKIELTGV